MVVWHPNTGERLDLKGELNPKINFSSFNI